MTSSSIFERDNLFARLSLRDGRDVRGTVFSYDRRSDLLAMLEPESGKPGKYSVRLLNLRNVPVAEVLEARPSTDAMPTLPDKTAAKTTNKPKRKKNKKKKE